MNDAIIGVIGAGAMGSGIAQVAATAGHEVLLYDVQKDAVVRAREKILKILNRLVEKGRMTDEEAKAVFGRIYLVDDLSGFSACTVVIEAVVERLDVKKKLFVELESIVQSSCILATNTSSLSVTAIASACRYSDRVVGTHFFNPPGLMKLVEIVPASQTDPQVTEYVTSLVTSWGKLTVEAKDTPGFIVNRIARPFYSEALRILDEGIADIATIDWAMTELGGFRMGPFSLMDYIGNDVNFKITEGMYHSYYQEARYKPSFTQKQMVEAGYFGRKTGRGFYDYGEGSDQPFAVKDKKLGKKIKNRILTMLINEAADALYYGIADREAIEQAMTKGVNYPKGLFEWAEEIGIKKCVRRMDRLYAYYHEERYRCSPMLREMAKK